MLILATTSTVAIAGQLNNDDCDQAAIVQGLTFAAVEQDIEDATTSVDLCMSANSPNTYHDDRDVPAPGAAYYYIVRATNACGAGPWGPSAQARSVTCPLTG